MSGLDRIGETSPRRVDHIAEEEEKAIIEDSKRKRKTDNVKNWIYIVILCLFTIATVAVILIRILHLILPIKNDWLTKEQIANINDFFVSGGIGATIVKLFNSVVSDKRRS